jgi:flavin-dependent dehydrogenase
MIPNIRYFYHSQVKEIKLKAENLDVVEGMVVQENEAEIEIKADFFIDASGAGSKTPTWLERLGYLAPVKTEIKVDLFYARRIYRSLSPHTIHTGSVLVYPNPPLFKCGGGLSPIEEGRWIVTLFGYGMDSIPGNDRDFLQFANALQQPDIYNLIVNAIPENDVSIYRFPALRRYHYEKLNRFPGNLIVLGDAFCRIDPVFGQGMSIAAHEAMELKKELEKVVHKQDLLQISKKVHRRFSKVVDIPWLIALSEDFRYSHTEGVKPAGLSILMWYVKQIIFACSRHQHIYTKLINVLHLKAHPFTLFAPSVLKTVLLEWKKLK